MIKCLVIGLGRIGMLYDNPKYPNQIWSHTKAIKKSKHFTLNCGIDKNSKNLSIFKILKFSDIIKKLNIIVDKAKKP